MSNCLVFAIKQWIKEGGYLAIRKSKVGWWPHFLWFSKDRHSIKHFVPLKYQEGRVFPKILFTGIIKNDDE